MHALHLASPDAVSLHACGAMELLLSAPHPLNARLSRGHVPVSEKPTSVLSARPCGREAIKVARPSLTYDESTGSYSIFAYTAGAALCHGHRARARRVAIGLSPDAFVEDAPARATVQARALLSGAVLWLAESTEADSVFDAFDAASAASVVSQVAEFRAYARARTALARAMDQERRHERRQRRHASASMAAVGAVTADDDVLPAAVQAHSLVNPGQAYDRAQCEDAVCARTSESVSLLLHTCDAYARFWAGWARRFHRHWPSSELCWPLHFANEVATPAAHVLQGGSSLTLAHLPTGSGEFSSRLRRALLKLRTPLVLYMQEDMWLIRAHGHAAWAAPEPRGAGRSSDETGEEQLAEMGEADEGDDGPSWQPVAAVDVDMSALLRCAEQLILDGTYDGIRFEGSAMVRAGLYHLEATNHSCRAADRGRRRLPIYQLASRTNRWLFSHQPGLWNRHRLLYDADGGGAYDGGDAYDGGGANDAAAAAGVADGLTEGTTGPVVRAGEDPWLNELMGSLRARRRGLRVGLVVVEWFRAVSSGGVLNEEGKELVSEEIRHTMSEGQAGL